MKALRLLATIGLFLLAPSGAAIAADWMTTEGGSVVCTKVNADGTCWVATAAETTSAISVQQCAKWTVTVYGTATSVMPQTCTDSACGTAEDLLTTGLTGAGSLIFAHSDAPFNFIRLVTGDTVTVSIKCGR